MNAFSIRLSNGLRVVGSHIPDSEVEAVYVFYNVGAKNERDGIYGGSHLVEHVLFRSIKGLEKSIDELVEGVGGYFNGFTTYDTTAYVEVLPVDKAELGFMIEAKRMKDALFLENEFELERSIVLSEFDMNENDEEARMMLTASRKMWDSHPYRHMVIGVRRDLESVKRDELYNYYRRYYNPSNAVLVAVGGLTRSSIEKLAELHFSSIEPGEVKGDVEPWDEQFNGIIKVTMRGSTMVPRLLVLFKSPGLHNAQGFSRQLFVDFILIGDKRLAYGLTASEPASIPRFARLYRLVEEGTASSVYASYELTYMNGPYGIVLRGVKDPDKAYNRLIEVILEKPNADEVNNAIARIKTRLINTLDSPSKLGQLYGVGELFANDPEHLVKLMSNAQYLGAEDYVNHVEELIKSAVVVYYG
ncbi:M16 family metallopeptidase [Caldivirga sp. UBA161]|uniref:M16 family metallopeptidase n=1 Tax=Caldivirga sp. UBA161 TaxID=1915569 RepID=UPI0025C356F5|nr:pitrilysin family protein [Caldivirga sp. UBA161]